MIMELYLVIFSAFILDLIFGDPRWIPHPICLIGSLALKVEKVSRKMFDTPSAAGFICIIIVLSLVLSVLFFVLLISIKLSHWVFIAVSIVLLYTSIATKDLLKHSDNIHAAMVPSFDLERAREKLSWIVGRDTRRLNKVEIIRAAVESVAENLVDGITAPLFWAIFASLFSQDLHQAVGLAVGGAFFYKTVNTMDSMFGYKSERYLKFGFYAAKLDDLVNLLPARLTGLLIIPVSALIGLNWKGCAKIFFRDRKKHTSPNAGHPEAAFAGALDIQLGGPSTYDGTVISKPWLGSSDRELVPDDIKQANTLALMSASFTLFILLIIRFALDYTL